MCQWLLFSACFFLPKIKEGLRTLNFNCHNTDHRSNQCCKIKIHYIWIQILKVSPIWIRRCAPGYEPGHTVTLYILIRLFFSFLNILSKKSFFFNFTKVVACDCEEIYELKVVEILSLESFCFVFNYVDPPIRIQIRNTDSDPQHWEEIFARL